MAISSKELADFRNELIESVKPLFFYDDDPDGLSSFLLCYRFIKDGKGVVVKSKPILEEMFANKVDEFSPDKVIILDVPMVSDEFLDKVSTPIVWLDHHPPQESRGTKYFNPRLNDDENNNPTSYWVWKSLSNDNPEDLWIGMVGCIGDWFLPDFKDEFCEKYPDLLDKDVSRPQDALFNSKLGEVVKIFSFALKGKTKDVYTDLKILTRIKSPYELLNQETAAAKKIYKRFSKINKNYEKLKADAISQVTDKKIINFLYDPNDMSFTADLSNELLYLYPDKVILVGREKNGEIKYSLRSTNIALPPILDKIFKDVRGYGGGHTNACGACVNSEDKDKFLEMLETSIKQ